MVKYIFLITFFYATCVALFAQQNYTKSKEILERINTLENVVELLSRKDSTMVAWLQSFSFDDTTKRMKKILTHIPGDIFTMELDHESFATYKVFDIIETKEYRYQYILFADDKITIDQLDSLKKEIDKKLDFGVAFGDLVSQFSVDSNLNISGDSGWVRHGQVYQEIEDAVKSHNFGDVFYVDVPAFQRYYLVKNAFKPQIQRTMQTVAIKE
jgi:hypothetical protein